MMVRHTQRGLLGKLLDVVQQSPGYHILRMRIEGANHIYWYAEWVEPLDAEAAEVVASVRAANRLVGWSPT